jgi:hypothetical protein
MKKSKIFDIIDKLSNEEDQFLHSEFLSPVINNKPIQVKISGIIMQMYTAPKNFQGWGVFKPKDRNTAKFVRAPSMTERRKYLKLFPTIRLIAHHQNDHMWYGTNANTSDTRFKISGSVPVYLAQEVQLFDTICVRFDGNICWFDEVDPRKSPKSAMYLREALSKFTKPNLLEGISKEELQAYQIAYKIEYENSEEAKKEQATNRIKIALERSGATYKSHIERDDTFTIEYQIDGNTHKSTVEKETLSVLSAGICLSGYDKDFDLQSLVCVIREGHKRNHIVNTEGRNWNEYGYHVDRDDDYDDDDDDW